MTRLRGSVFKEVVKEDAQSEPLRQIVRKVIEVGFVDSDDSEMALVIIID